MALKAETKKKIATLLKIKEEDFENALKDDKEVDVPISEDIEVFEKKELETRDAQMKAEGKTDGEKEARSAFVKEVGKKLGFEPKGERIGDLVSELQGKINASGDEKLKTLQDQVNLLTKDKETLEKEKTTLASEKDAIKNDYGIIQDFPAERRGATKGGFAENEYLLAVKGILEFKADGVYRDGKLLRDEKTQAALPRKEAIALVFKERNWIEESGGGSGGRGGGNGNPGGGNPGGGIKKYSQAVEAWKALDPVNNTNDMSPEFTDYVGKIAAADPQFNMYE